LILHLTSTLIFLSQGFLSTSDGAASGNYALSVAAVHWIQNNIADFGGDRTQVTVMGHGYGAALANLLSLAPVTQRKSCDRTSHRCSSFVETGYAIRAPF